MQKATEAAKAVNSLLQLNSKDNQSLLEVIQEYSLEPECHSEEELASDFYSGDESDMNEDRIEPGKMYEKASIVN